MSSWFATCWRQFPHAYVSISPAGKSFGGDACGAACREALPAPRRVRPYRPYPTGLGIDACAANGSRWGAFKSLIRYLSRRCTPLRPVPLDTARCRAWRSPECFSRQRPQGWESHHTVAAASSEQPGPQTFAFEAPGRPAGSHRGGPGPRRHPPGQERQAGAAAHRVPGCLEVGPVGVGSPATGRSCPCGVPVCGRLLPASAPTTAHPTSAPPVRPTHHDPLLSRPN